MFAMGFHLDYYGAMTVGNNFNRTKKLNLDNIEFSERWATAKFFALFNRMKNNGFSQEYAEIGSAIDNIDISDLAQEETGEDNSVPTRYKNVTHLTNNNVISVTDTGVLFTLTNSKKGSDKPLAKEFTPDDFVELTKNAVVLSKLRDHYFPNDIEHNRPILPIRFATESFSQELLDNAHKYLAKYIVDRLVNNLQSDIRQLNSEDAQEKDTHSKNMNAAYEELGLEVMRHNAIRLTLSDRQRRIDELAKKAGIPTV